MGGLALLTTVTGHILDDSTSRLDSLGLVAGEREIKSKLPAMGASWIKRSCTVDAGGRGVL